MRFTHESLPQRVHFATGEGPATVAAEVRALGASRVMVIASERERASADPVAAAIAASVEVVLRHEEVVMHVPVDVAARARLAAVTCRADVLVSVGGGSTTGLAKAVALSSGLSIIAVPTTFAGSEATDVWGLTEDGKKTTGVDSSVLPASVIYDADLLLTLPPAMVVASGLNALAHSVDSMWGPRADPIDRALAGEGIVSLNAGLLQIASGGLSTPAIEQTLYGAYLAAVAFASAGSGLHHKVCHVLGGMFDLPHAETHAAVLPHVLAFNAPNAPEAERRIATAFGSRTAIAGLATLSEALAAHDSLQAIGMPRAGIADAVPAILRAVPANNPTPVDTADLTKLLTAAWNGADQ